MASTLERRIWKLLLAPSAGYMLMAEGGDRQMVEGQQADEEQRGRG